MMSPGEAGGAGAEAACPDSGHGPTTLRERLLAAGWEERFSASGRRLDEAADEYRSLGFEVRLEDPAGASAPGSCVGCFAEAGADGPTLLIFTRPAGSPPAPDEDLFD